MMAIDWSKISPVEFEKLCYRLLEEEGFFNLEWYGAAGQDRGRDIIGFRDETPLPGQRVQKKWLVQCKRFLTPLSKCHLHDELVKAVEHQPDGVLFMVSNALSANLRDWLKPASQQFAFEYVFVWDAVQLESLLSRHPSIQQELFGTRDRAADELLQTITGGENKRVEFRETVPSPEALVREICAFANTSGGRILLGVSDDGAIVGFKDAQIQDKVQSWCNDLCDPPIRDIETREYALPDGTVTVIEIPEGDDKPYLGSHQVWLRAGMSVRNATREETGRYFARRGFFQYSPDLDFALDLKAYRGQLSTFISSLEEGDSPLERAEHMEKLLETLLSGVNGFGVRSRVRTAITELDFIITNKGTNPFLSRFDLYILVEWKATNRPVGLESIDYLARRASMIGTKTAILFTVNGLTKSAVEQVSLLHRTQSLYVIVLDRKDLESIATGENFISILETKHIALALDY